MYKGIPNGKDIAIYKNNKLYFGKVIDHKFNGECIGIETDEYSDNIKYSSIDHVYDINYNTVLLNELVTEFENTKENRLNLLLLDHINIIESYNKKYCIALENLVPSIEWVDWPFFEY